jgi:NAD-dependent dihydropyrimidine dehydrogenase PreA subunit
MNYAITKSQISSLLSSWSANYRVFLPHLDKGTVSYMSEWSTQKTDLFSWYQNTTISVKRLVLPGVETLFNYRKIDSGYNLDPVILDNEEKLVFAVRPCDARALTLLDKVFDEGFIDPYYKARRNKTLLIGLGCTQPCTTCFCTSVGSHPHDETGLDVLITDLGEKLAIKSVSNAGKNLLEGFETRSNASRYDEVEVEKIHDAARLEVTLKLDVSHTVYDLRANFDEQEFWQVIAAKCISCGVCTLLCPTCYCFDINDEMLHGLGKRCRNLDSCSFPIYTKMPMENPRSNKWQRVRNKVCHKYEFYPMKYKEIACTGCGRCIRLCPVNWDITEVIGSVPSKA